MITSMAIGGAVVYGGLTGFDKYVKPQLRKRFRPQPIGLPEGGPRSDDPRYMEKYTKAEANLRQGAEMRRLQEIDNTRGARVWFSRYTENGRLQHWVLAIDNIKYELRRDPYTGAYGCKITPNFDIKLERRAAALKEKAVPTVDNRYYICLIGWTRLSPREIERISAEVDAEFGEYKLLWNNCHHFLQRLADRIVSEHALDWSWFRDNVRTPYQEGMRLPVPPPSLEQRQRDEEDNLNAAATYNVSYNVSANWPGIEQSLSSQPTAAAHLVAAKSVAAKSVAAKSVATHSTVAGHSGVAQAGAAHTGAAAHAGAGAAHAVVGHSAGVAAGHIVVAGVGTAATAYVASNAYNGPNNFGGGGFGGFGC